MHIAGWLVSQPAYPMLIMPPFWHMICQEISARNETPLSAKSIVARVGRTRVDRRVGTAGGELARGTKAAKSTGPGVTTGRSDGDGLGTIVGKCGRSEGVGLGKTEGKRGKVGLRVG